MVHLSGQHPLHQSLCRSKLKPKWRTSISTNSPPRVAAPTLSLRTISRSLSRLARTSPRRLKSPPRAATRDELKLCQTPGYISTAKRDGESGRSTLSTGDTDICGRSWEAALHAVGTAFCIVRPPGHHAMPDRGRGFCLFNNVAIAARYAQTKYDLDRILIADWDVHRGNGTQDIFYDDPSVFFFSTHQSSWYPGTGSARERGENEGDGTTLNCPLPAGSGRDEILGAFRKKLLPAMKEYRPDLVLISAGFDSRADDPLGQFRLADQDFAELTSLLQEVADEHSDGRLISVLEGG